MPPKPACLIIHGFAGNVSEIEPLNQYLIGQGFITACPQLAGHTGNRHDLAGVGHREWLRSAEIALKELLKQTSQVAIVGFSMGGLLAVQLAQRSPVAGIVFVNTPIFHWDLKQILANLQQDIKAKKFNHIKRYHQEACSIPLSALINFKLLLVRTKPLFKQITCPVLIAQGLKDDAVQPRSAQFIYDRVNSTYKSLKLFPEAGHLLFASNQQTDLLKAIAELLKLLNSNPQQLLKIDLSSRRSDA